MKMVQQVQKAIEITPENTLETIEAIWTSSRKIIIWRQTRQKLYGQSWVTYNQEIPYQSYPIGTYEDMSGTVTLSDKVWDLDYLLVWDAVKIPLQWNYSVTITPEWRWGANYWKATTKLWINWQVAWQTTRVDNDLTPATLYLVLWKFDLLKLTITTQALVNTAWGRKAYMTIQRL